MLHDKGDYGKGAAQLAKKYFEKAGIKVVLYEGVTPGAVDYSAIVTKIRAKHPQLVVWGGYHPEASKIVTLMRKKRMKTLFLGPDGVKDDTFIKVAGKYAEGVYTTGPRDISSNPLAMRATSQDKVMAALLGININRVISFTFIVGSATAALGGLLIASHIGQINFYMGFIAGIKAFVAAVLGGIGSIPGAVLGSFVLGLSESVFTGYISSDYEDVFAFLILVFILIFRPSGILGRAQTQKV